MVGQEELAGWPRIVIVDGSMFSLVRPNGRNGVWGGQYMHLRDNNGPGGEFVKCWAWYGLYTDRWYPEARRQDGRVVQLADGFVSLELALRKAIELMTCDQETLDTLGLIQKEEC